MRLCKCRVHNIQSYCKDTHSYGYMNTGFLGGRCVDVGMDLRRGEVMHCMMVERRVEEGM